LFIELNYPFPFYPTSFQLLPSVANVFIVLQAKKVVRVYFMDDSFKAFGIDPGTNADQLRQIAIEKIELKEDSCFALFEKKGEWGTKTSAPDFKILIFSVFYQSAALRQMRSP
jgi:hypothetical protein